MGIRDAGIDEIIARESLRRLVTTYSRAVDRRDLVLLRSLYDDAAVESHGRMFHGGPDAYVAFCGQALAAYEATVHYVVNMEFAIDGDLAEGEIHKINYHRTRRPDCVEIVTGSRSLDRYVRRAGAWRFLARTVTLDWARRRPADPRAWEDFAAGSPPGSAGPDDLSYQVLRGFARRSGEDGDASGGRPE